MTKTKNERRKRTEKKLRDIANGQQPKAKVTRQA